MKIILDKEFEYIRDKLYAPDNGRPYMIINTRNIPVARVIAETKLERQLHTDRDNVGLSETVHHINQNRYDNRWKNLYVCTIDDHIAIHESQKEGPWMKGWKEFRQNVVDGVQPHKLWVSTAVKKLLRQMYMQELRSDRKFHERHVTIGSELAVWEENLQEARDKYNDSAMQEKAKDPDYLDNWI